MAGNVLCVYFVTCDKSYFMNDHVTWPELYRFQWQSKVPDPNISAPKVCVLTSCSVVAAMQWWRMILSWKHHFIVAVILGMWEKECVAVLTKTNIFLVYFNSHCPLMCYMGCYCSSSFYNNFMITSWALVILQMYCVLHLNCIMTLMSSYYYSYFIKEEIET